MSDPSHTHIETTPAAASVVPVQSSRSQRAGSRHGGLVALQRSAGNAAVAHLLATRTRPAAAALQRSLVLGPVDAHERTDGAADAAATGDAEAATSASGPAGAAAPPAGDGGDAAGGDPGTDGAGGSTEDVGGGAQGAGGAGGSEGAAGSADGSSGDAAGADGDAGGGGAGAAGAGGEVPPGAASAPGGQGSALGGQGSADDDGGAPGPLVPATLDRTTADQLAEFASRFGSRADEMTGAARQLLDPRLRRAAARINPDRRADLVLQRRQRNGHLFPAFPQTAQAAAPRLQRGAHPVQRQGVPTQKVKVTLPNFQPIPLFTDRNVGSWFLLSGSIESPTYEGEAKPPDSIRDDTTEQELQMTADGKVSGYAATFHKETLAKVGAVEVEGKVATEVTSKSVKVSGLSVKLPNLGQDGALLQGQFDFDLLDWPVGQPPGVMVLSLTTKVGIEEKFTRDGWAFTGQLYLPVKLAIKPNPAKVAEYVTRVMGPRLAAAAPAGLAIAAPLVAGGVCLALWINAVQAGQDFATATDYAKLNTLGYVTAYFNTIMGYTHQRYANQGAAQGTKAAQQVLDKLRFDELPEGARARIRAEYLDAGTLDMPGVQASIWNAYRDQAVTWYRANHDWDAWAHDNGLPSDLRKLKRLLDVMGPPWSISNY